MIKNYMIFDFIIASLDLLEKATVADDHSTSQYK